jgi:hypothetical protein
MERRGGRHPGDGVQAFMGSCLGGRYARSWGALPAHAPLIARVDATWARRAAIKAPAPLHTAPAPTD